MALTASGLNNGGNSLYHYRFQYDDSLSAPINPGGPEPTRTNAVIAKCENDFNLMSGWFPKISFDVNFRIPVNVTQYGDSAGWNLRGRNLTVTINPGNGQASFVRYLLVSEMVEQFMRAQGLGWFGSGTEGSEGEGLSRFLAAQFLLTNGLGNSPSEFANSYKWLSSSRADYVNNINPTDDGPDAITGCSLLFIYYLYSQLGFTINSIVAAGAPTPAGVYKNLTGDDRDPFPFFKQLLDSFFPGTSTIPGPNPDNPFPLIPFKQGTGSSFSLSTATDAIEVFWIRSDGMVFTNGRDPNFNQGNWNNPINNVAPLAGSADPRSGVAAVSTQPGDVEVFWIRPDGMVFTNARNPNINQGNWNNPINNVAPAPGSADPRSGVAAVSTQPGAVDVFWIRPDGMVFTNARDPNFNRGNWNNPINNVAPAPGSADPRSGVAAVSAQPGVVEVFWIRTDGMVFTNSRDPNINQGNWNNPINNVAPAPGSADPRSGITAMSTQQGTVQVFWIRPDGVVLTNARDPNINQGNWNNPIGIGSGADPRSGVAAISRQFGCVDVFWVSAVGEIMTSARNPFKNNGDFTSPTAIAPPGSAYSSSPIGAACTSLNAVEVFWIRSDGMIFTNAQNPNINGGNWNQPINNVAPLPGSAATPQR